MSDIGNSAAEVYKNMTGNASAYVNDDDVPEEPQIIFYKGIVVKLHSLSQETLEKHMVDLMSGKYPVSDRIRKEFKDKFDGFEIPELDIDLEFIAKYGVFPAKTQMPEKIFYFERKPKSVMSLDDY